ncbi:hydroxymethylglutaryl-CoA lyase [bacterium SCSIO 12643]|nr:hydroxymethylglutaryl-CoA lyase [bacterium SCSIO 12643]
MKIIECPRDAMQGLHDFIPTAQKIKYINQLLKVGFDTLDMGSFVSPKAIPQMRDTQEVIKNLDLSDTDTKLLTIIGNTRGAKEATQFDEIHYLGFPFSISDTFQKRNINSTIEDSFHRAEDILNCCVIGNKELVVYISMAFGNPYNDPWDADIVLEWAHRLHNELGVDIISLSDTIGVANPETIDYLFTSLIPELPQVEFGAHLHTTPDTWKEKVHAAVHAGCERFDGAFKGFGGCPMAKDDLTGNMPTENLISYFNEKKTDIGLDMDAVQASLQMTTEVFPL